MLRRNLKGESGARRIELGLNDALGVNIALFLEIVPYPDRGVLADGLLLLAFRRGTDKLSENGLLDPAELDLAVALDIVLEAASRPPAPPPTCSPKVLAGAGWRQSMSARGYCYDNAFAESCFASIKAELIPDSGMFLSQKFARGASFDYLETFYNRCRLHSAIGYLSPSQFLDLYFQKQNQYLN